MGFINIQEKLGNCILFGTDMFYLYDMKIFLGIFWLAKAPKPGEKNKGLQMSIDIFGKGFPFVVTSVIVNPTNLELFDFKRSKE